LILIYSKIRDGEQILTLPPLPMPTVWFPEERNFYIHHVQINSGTFPSLCPWYIAMELVRVDFSRDWWGRIVQLTTHFTHIVCYQYAKLRFHCLCAPPPHGACVQCQVPPTRSISSQRESDGKQCQETALLFLHFLSNLPVKNCKCWKCALRFCHLLTPWTEYSQISQWWHMTLYFRRWAPSHTNMRTCESSKR
jgi:hypothetical protein